MNKIEQILCRRSIDGAKQIRQLFNNWSDEEIVQFYRELESYASQQMPSDINDILLEDCKQMRKAGNDLAIAAMRVVGQYDGIHRLSAAVSYWNNVISTEGGRLKSLQQENQTED